MPIFLDYHQLEGFTIEEIRAAHQRDIDHQKMHGVRFIQYWINEPNATVFCLVEGPDKEACKACHLEAKNGTPCNIQEVEPLFLKTFMGEGKPIDRDLTLFENGQLDPATRTIMVIDLTEVEVKNLQKKKKEYIPLKKNIRQLITESKGRLGVNGSEDGFWTSVFDSSSDALQCAKHLQKIKGDFSSLHEENHSVIKIGLSNGQPLTRQMGLFEVVIKLAQRLCVIAKPGEILLSSQLRGAYDLEIDQTPYKILTDSQGDFVNKLFDITEKYLHSTTFDVNTLCSLIGMSRAQLYRKITSQIGIGPKAFINKARMRKAFWLIKNRNQNISEAAFDLGFSNPSHFSKVFHDNFGYRPSQI